MIEFTVNEADLKKALTLSTVTTGESKSIIEGQSLFDLNDSVLTIYSSDRSTFSRAIISVNGSGKSQFTIDPTKILNLIKVSGIDLIKFIYHEETATVEVYASEEEDSFISLISMAPEMFPSIEENYEKAFELKTMDSEYFMMGLKFTGGFLPGGKNIDKFNNIFISDGVMYGSNGHNIAGAFSCSSYVGLTDIALPGVVVNQITGIFTKLNFTDMCIKTTSNVIIFTTPDQNFSYGFTKVKVPMPRIPITIEKPDTNNWTIEPKTFLKKITRLQISGDENIELCFNKNHLDLVTISDRPSRESMGCIGEQEASFITENKKLEHILKLFTGDSLLLYEGKRRINVYTKGQLQKSDETVEFVSTALIALA